MFAVQAHGINKTACRRDTHTHIKSILGASFSSARFGVLLGPEAGDVPEIRANGNYMPVAGFELNNKTRREAMAVCNERKYRDVFFHGDITKPAPGHMWHMWHTDAFYDWCGAASTCLPLTMQALQAHWVPRETSTITVGVTTRETNPEDCKEVHQIKRAMKPWEAEDSAWVRAAYFLAHLRPFVKRTFSLNMRMTSIRSYKGWSKAGENHGAHMVYATFECSNRILGPRPPERFHYLSGLCERPISAVASSVYRSARALRAWDTMREKNTVR